MTAPIICYLDLETTGLDIAKDRITELGYVVTEWRAKKPWWAVTRYLYTEDQGPISPEIEELTGISTALLLDHGEDSEDVLHQFLDATMDCNYFVARNAHGFDRPMLMAALARYPFEGSDHPIFDRSKWLCSKEDIEHKGKSTHLGYIAADHGFLNPFPHSALFDVMTMRRIFESFELAPIIERAKIPWVVARAHTSFDQKDLAKAQRFRWEDVGDGQKYTKQWVKLIKADKYEAEVAAAKGMYKVTLVENAASPAQPG